MPPRVWDLNSFELWVPLGTCDPSLPALPPALAPLHSVTSDCSPSIAASESESDVPLPDLRRRRAGRGLLDDGGHTDKPPVLQQRLVLVAPRAAEKGDKSGVGVAERV